MDQTRDTNRAQLHRLSSLYGAPDFVKTANAAELLSARPMATLCYGDPRRQHYPLHTKAATWASYAFFLENQKTGQYNQTDAGMIESRIVHAGTVHGIGPTLGRLKEAILKDRPKLDAELPDDDFAAVWSEQDGTRRRFLPMRNSLEVVKAASYLQEHYVIFPYLVRKEMAERIRTKVAEYGVNLDGHAEFIEKQAGLGTCSAAEAADLVVGRVSASRKGPGALTENQHAMLKLANILRAQTTAVRSHETRVKIASVVDAFDRDAGLVGQVQRGELPRVEDVLFVWTHEKLANVAGDYVTTAIGSIYSTAELGRLKIASVRAVLGDGVADQLTRDGFHLDADKAAAALPKLPRGDCELIERLLEDAGVVSAAKQASTEGFKIENQYLAGLLASVT